MSHESHSDPLEFVRNMWSGMGFSLPGMVTPTVDVDELDKRIADMKAVEGWLKMNLNMLQMTIQGLEMQRATLSTLRQMGDIARQRAEAPAAHTEGESINPFAGWPWMTPSPETGTAEKATPAPSPTSEKPADDVPSAQAEAAANAAHAFADAAAAATNAAANAAMWPWQLMGEQAASNNTKKPAPKRSAAKAPATTTRKKPATTTAKKPAAATSTRTRKKPATSTASRSTRKKA